MQGTANLGHNKMVDFESIEKNYYFILFIKQKSWQLTRFIKL